MEELENIRKKLYETLQGGNPAEILRVSQELDIFVLYYTRKQLNLNR